MKKIVVAFSVLLFLIPLTSCNYIMNSGKIEGVGLLVTETIHDQVWGTKGYKGLLEIGTTFNVDVSYKEGIVTKEQVENAIEEFEKKGINLIIGNGDHYAALFNNISDQYPTIHFVSVNGDAKNKNTTSLNFQGYAMGFFGGMVAAHMSETNALGVIGAFEWQPEIKGFVEGAKFENSESIVNISYVENWDDEETALKYVDQLHSERVDVFYPAGDGFNVPVIEKVKEKGLYVIGYVTDQKDLGKNTVLTSTVQHIDKLFVLAAQRYNNGTLESGNLLFDMQDDVISIGEFSPVVPKSFAKKIQGYVEYYKEHEKLPNKKESKNE